MMRLVGGESMLGSARVTIALAAFFLSIGASVAADNAACWGDPSMEQMSCTELTERVLSGLKNVSRARLVALMKAEGVHLDKSDPHSWHFISNAKRGAGAHTGNLNVTLEGDRVVLLRAMIDVDHGRPIEYVWNAAQQTECSDFPKSRLPRCN
jgi:hypothetical protein